MNLIIDVGNTLTKFAVFSNGKLLHKVAFELKAFKKNYSTIKVAYPKLQSAIISSVGRLQKDDIDCIENDLFTVLLNHNTKLPFKNNYKTPKTLGVDRMALVAASVNEFPNKNALIIDAGTCITYDFVTTENNYLGGAISPGIRLRYKALNNLTANLPLLNTEKPKTIIGNTTDASIHSGVIFGMVKEIDGVIEHYSTRYQDLTVILTGGDANFLSEQLKNSIFANSNFLLEGLNFILDYNSI